MMTPEILLKNGYTPYSNLEHNTLYRKTIGNTLWMVEIYSSEYMQDKLRVYIRKDTQETYSSHFTKYFPKDASLEEIEHWIKEVYVKL